MSPFSKVMNEPLIGMPLKLVVRGVRALGVGFAAGCGRVTAAGLRKERSDISGHSDVTGDPGAREPLSPAHDFPIAWYDSGSSQTHVGSWISSFPAMR